MNHPYIIFADDDAADLELITELFRQYNSKVEVLEFMNGLDVLQFLENKSGIYGLPLLVVMDLEMQGFNGRETLIAIRQHYFLKNIPVVICSEFENYNDEEFCNTNGASWVTKSNDKENIKQIAKVLAEFCNLQKFS